MSKEKPLKMFEDIETPQDGFNINKNFASRYEHNNARNEKERLTAIYGKDPVDEESYDSETEDEDGFMLTTKAEDKYNDLIKRIIKCDETLLTETKEGEDYFHDEDF